MTSPGSAVTISGTLRRAIHALAAGKRRAPDGVLTAEAETLFIAAFAKAGLVRLSRHELYARGAEECPGGVLSELERTTAQRVSGTPLQYVTGEQVFLDHIYHVTPDVLIPRPETETLATVAFAELSQGPILGLEIGLGCGILAIELLARFPELQMIATEAGQGALRVARANATAILGPGAHRLSAALVKDRMLVCEPLAVRLAGAKADFLISNPPYLAGAYEAEEQVARHEPALALWSPEADPVYFYRAIARDAKGLLNDQAPVFVEIPHERASEIRGVFTAQGWSVTIKPDLSGRDRVLVARRKA